MNRPSSASKPSFSDPAAHQVNTDTSPPAPPGVPEAEEAAVSVAGAEESEDPAGAEDSAAEDSADVIAADDSAEDAAADDAAEDGADVVGVVLAALSLSLPQAATRRLTAARPAMTGVRRM